MSQYPGEDIERESRSADLPCDAGGGASRWPSPCGARVAAVAPESPADDAGFTPGCFIAAVDGQPVRDIIDWRWLSSEPCIEVSYVDTDGDAGVIELERDWDEDWGFEFDGLVFDGVKQCRNACTFCFMHQLPKGMRPSLYLRDDDFRLSFLVGTFVTLTNLTAEDEARIIEQHISPLRVSLQVSDADVRRRIIGRHAQHGIEALERLLAAGIEFHAQIVLVPDENDGAILADTLAWAYERPGILNVGIVPLGYTRHQTRFDHSFNDPAAARAVLDLVEPFQRKALEERGTPWVFTADEFYRNAWGTAVIEHLPEMDHYGDFSLFEDGIGLIRSVVDDWARAEQEGIIAACAASLRAAGVVARFVTGCAQREYFDVLVERSGIGDVFSPLYIENEFFGGNVDVTGLLVGADIARAIRQDALANNSVADAGGLQIPRILYLVPNIVFNDDGLLLDDLTLEDMEKEAGESLHVVSLSPLDYFREITELLR